MGWDFTLPPKDSRWRMPSPLLKENKKIKNKAWILKLIVEISMFAALLNTIVLYLGVYKPSSFYEREERARI